VPPRSRNLVLEAVASCPSFQRIRERFPGPTERLTVGGARGSVGAALFAAIHRAFPDRILVAVAPDSSTASSIEADLDALLGEGDARLYPQRETLTSETDEPNLEIGGMRVEAIEGLFSGQARAVVTTLRALQERAPVPTNLAELRITLRVGDRLGMNSLIQSLEERGFERVPVVEEVGQIAVRGGLVDIFSFGSSDPLRVEFWGDEIESLRAFDILDQRSTGKRSVGHVLPVDFRPVESDEEVPHSLLELLPSEAILFRLSGDAWEGEVEKTWARAREIHQELTGHGLDPKDPAELFLEPEKATSLLASFPRIEVTSVDKGEVIFNTSLPPVIDRDMKKLAAVLKESAAQGRRTLLLCDNEGQTHRLEEILGEGRIPGDARIGVGALDGGFLLECADPPLLVLVDHEIFRRSRRVRRARRFRGGVSLESLAQLSPGDYVVHMDHGIGQFKGLERVEVAGEQIEALAIEYAGGEILRVPIYRLDLVERWVGDADDGRPPETHRIGGRKWKTLKRKTQAAIERMTAELLELYARREVASGFSFSPDSRWQKEMESSFLYEDTPDQRKAAEDVKKDMESAKPMDRLICGDVGYGKTEVAIRAAFKAVQDGKQVAVLAPTTVLVEQHKRTFEERLADYPVTIGALSRLRSGAGTRGVLDRLEAGGLDIVIGTHRLLSRDVRFRELGLLVVDEEQRFGVKHKERLKQLKESVDVLTLTATPIPRTLYLSLSRVRDLTLIRTPPRDRQPILTHVIPWSEGIVSEAIHREIDRGGQAFFLYNRVETILEAAQRVRRLVPEAAVVVAHGQMSPSDLEQAMTQFVDGEADVLVCSSIIENGLDVPNANTLVVDRADRFGLSQLYQIRGRVGRSDRRAFCYLIVPDGVTDDARKRLRVLEHYTELGSGYSVALRDLELRGAGNLLGAEQSGFAHAVGIEAYLRLLERTVERLKEAGDGGELPDAEVNLSGSAYLPDDYIQDAGQKLHLYRRISRVRQRAEVAELRSEVADRFGPPPPEVVRLFDATVLRILGRRLGVERILIRGRAARLNFHVGVVPRLQVLERPLRDRQVDVEVRRLSPLSLALSQIGPEPLAGTLIEALSILAEEERGAAA
jgi:transcription-repair coupling factor (superfamily II helicase)